VRRRLTIAVLAVVTGTLVLTVTASVLLVERAAISSSENDLTPEAQALGELASERPTVSDLSIQPVLRRVGGFDTLAVVGVASDGTFRSLPKPLYPSVMNSSALLSGDTVTGNVGHEIFAAVPVAGLNAKERLVLGIPRGDTPVLVTTRHVKNPVNGVGYFVLVAGVVLVIGAVVAALVARRISAPLLEAVSATGQIAGGDLTARVPVRHRDYPELKDLADSINAMGESLSRSQGLNRQFLLSVSHDLRTPLTSIRGYADALAEGATDDTDSAVAIIGSEARRLERLVKDLLDLARLDARQFSFHTQRIDCVELVRSVALGFRPETGVFGVALETRLPGDSHLWVDADPDRLGQVVANLVENAFKFARSKVLVGAGEIGESNAIWVIDDGPGISEDDLPHVFERHFTSDRASAGKSGIGLGLAIVSELTGAMGGRCTAESPVSGGSGTRMTVWMKLQAPPETSSESPDTIASESGTGD
jgi:signal transduction histidine kinase